MRFRMSTVFLFTLTPAILLGWCVERASRHRRDIVGTWYYPTNDLTVLGYTSLLEIRWDGTFTRFRDTVRLARPLREPIRWKTMGELRFT